MGKYRRHSLAFKCQVINEHKSGNISINRLARRHDLSPGLIQIWLRKFDRGEFDVKSKTSRERNLETHIARLERKIGQLTIENDHLRQHLLFITNGAERIEDKEES